MEFRLFRLRFRRELRRQRRQVEDLSQQAEQTIEQDLFGRMGKLKPVRRFVIGWSVLFVLLIVGTGIQLALLSSTYQTLKPVPGGIYSEGILGSFTTANPMYAVNDVDATVSRLVFAGLMKYDSHNQLVGDLASGYSVSTDGKTYTVTLRPHITWQDGQPLTSRDVVFTFQSIQNPDAGSPLQSSWQGIELSAPDPHTVVFKLPDPLAAFPQSLTTGIVPEHLLKRVPASALRTADFNTLHPVGTGPFAWQGVQASGTDPSQSQEQVTLLPFVGYHAGAPKLKEFIVHAYADKQQLIEALKDQQLTAAAGLGNVPDGLSTKTFQVHDLLLTAGNYVFFKTSEGVLSDAKVRQALVAAADPSAIIKKLSYHTRPVREPLLMGQLAYDPALVQKTGSLDTARKLLQSDHWVMGPNDVRTKNGQELSFGLVALDTPENRMVTSMLTKQWHRAGAQVNVNLERSQDFTTSLTSHSYDAVLNGISIGTDPDVFVYWDSSQADIRSLQRLNLSEYKNTASDVALESGRTRLNPQLRVLKYKPFLQNWLKDAPALGLYQPRYLYITHGTVFGLSDHAVNSGTDRFANVQNWEIREARVTNN